MCSARNRIRTYIRQVNSLLLEPFSHPYVLSYYTINKQALPIELPTLHYNGIGLEPITFVLPTIIFKFAVSNFMIYFNLFLIVDLNNSAQIQQSLTDVHHVILAGTNVPNITGIVDGHKIQTIVPVKIAIILIVIRISILNPKK